MTDTYDTDHSTLPSVLHPPQTPSTISKNYQTISTPYTNAPFLSATSDTYSTSRKRARNDSWILETPDSMASPIPFANMEYRLAGGMDTPTAITSQYRAHGTETPDLAFRRGRAYDIQDRRDYFHEHGGDDITGMPGKDGNGRAPVVIRQPVQYTWGSMVFGLAGKVFDFCTASSFKGFFSGSGTSYTIRQANPVQMATPLYEHSDWFAIPTSSSSELDIDEPRANKRSKADRRDSWVMVQRYSETALQTRAQEARQSSTTLHKNVSPTRKTTTASTVTIGGGSKRPIANLRRTISTRTASSAELRAREKTTGSSQSPENSPRPRSSLLRPAASGSHTRGLSRTISPERVSQVGPASPNLAHSPRRLDLPESPLVKETRKHIDKVRKKEMADDIEIMRMNKQLKDLIQQGKEALGTRIEVDMDQEEDHL